MLYIYIYIYNTLMIFINVNPEIRILTSWKIMLLMKVYEEIKTLKKIKQ